MPEDVTDEGQSEVNYSLLSEVGHGLLRFPLDIVGVRVVAHRLPRNSEGVYLRSYLGGMPCSHYSAGHGMYLFPRGFVGVRLLFCGRTHTGVALHGPRRCGLVRFTPSTRWVRTTRRSCLGEANSHMRSLQDVGCEDWPWPPLPMDGGWLMRRSCLGMRLHSLVQFLATG